MSVGQWRAHAASAVMAYVRAAGGAVVWPEVEAVLAHTDWYARNVPDTPPIRQIDPHHLSYARRALLDAALLVADRTSLNRREVTAYLDAQGLQSRRETAIRRRGAAKRRLYRRFLTWTSDARLCGQVLERQVQATLDELRGFDLLLERARPGNVASIGGVEVPYGPLDHAGYLALVPGDPSAGFVGFAVEDKNVRSILYPSAQEVWDLLSKAGAFPTHVPILMARQVHYTTRSFFLAIGALAYVTTRQHFSPDIDGADFTRVRSGLSLQDAQILRYPDRPSTAIANFFTDTMRGANSADPSKPLAAAYQARWEVAAPICAEYSDLRESLGSEERTEIFQQLLEELDEAGLEVEGLRAGHRLEQEPPDVDIFDYLDDE